MNKGIFSMGIVLLVAAVFGFGCVRPGPRIVRAPNAATPSSTQQDSSDSSVAVLAYARVNGADADLVRDDQTADLQEGQALGSGDEIKVNSGTVELVYPDAGISRIESGSDIVLLAHSDEAKEGEVSTELQLLAGDIWTRFERLLGDKEQFSVNANGVVATVRGTAFGVSLSGDDVDVEVADHQVDVTTVEEQARTDSTPTTRTLRLVAGQGLKAKLSETKGINPTTLRKFVRNLSEKEKKTAGFAFGSQKIDLSRLRRPEKVIPLRKLPVLQQRFQERFQFLKKREAERLRTILFAAPTTTPDLKGYTTPSVNGPLQ